MLEGYRRDAGKRSNTTDILFYLKTACILIDKKDERLNQMKSRNFYKQYFSAYPDLVTVDQFRKMLGGMGDTQARKLLQENHVKHLIVRGTYLIPKTYVIDYVRSSHYAKYRLKLKSHIP